MLTSSGLRPKRSLSAPPIGNQMKLETPTNSVTISASPVLSLSTLLPKVGA